MDIQKKVSLIFLTFIIINLYGCKNIEKVSQNKIVEQEKLTKQIVKLTENKYSEYNFLLEKKEVITERVLNGKKDIVEEKEVSNIKYIFGSRKEVIEESNNDKKYIYNTEYSSDGMAIQSISKEKEEKIIKYDIFGNIVEIINNTSKNEIIKKEEIRYKYDCYGNITSKEIYIEHFRENNTNKISIGNDYSNKIEKYYIYNLKNKKERSVSIYNDFQKIEMSNYITEYDNLGRVIKEVEIIEEVPGSKKKVIATLKY